MINFSGRRGRRPLQQFAQTSSVGAGDQAARADSPYVTQFKPSLPLRGRCRQSRRRGSYVRNPLTRFAGALPKGEPIGMFVPTRGVQPYFGREGLVPLKITGRRGRRPLPQCKSEQNKGDEDGDIDMDDVLASDEITENEWKTEWVPLYEELYNEE